MNNIYTARPHHLPDELCEVLEKNSQVRIERIVSRGHCSAPGFWYDQEEHEFVLLLSGCARLTLLDPQEEVTLHPGDYLSIVAHRRHRLEWTDPDRDSIWLAVFYSAGSSLQS